MKLIDLEKAIEYAKEKDYIKMSNQERAVREVFALATVEAVPIDALDKIKADIEECLKALEEISKLPIQIYSESELIGRKLTYEQCLDFIKKHIGDTE